MVTINELLSGEMRSDSRIQELEAEIERLRAALEVRIAHLETTLGLIAHECEQVSRMTVVDDAERRTWRSVARMARAALGNEQNASNSVSTPESPIPGDGNQGQPGGMPGTTICKHGVNTAISICPSCAVREYQLRS